MKTKKLQAFEDLVNPDLRLYVKDHGGLECENLVGYSGGKCWSDFLAISGF